MCRTEYEKNEVCWFGVGEGIIHAVGETERDRERQRERVGLEDGCLWRRIF